MTKLKVCAALVATAVLLGAGGFAYRAAGQDRRGPVKSAEVRQPADAELLRKEVELLKLQVELLQEKVRAQGIELRELKGQGGRAAPSAGRPVGSNPFGAPVPTAPVAGAAPSIAPAAPTPVAPVTAAAPAGALPALAPSVEAPTAPAAPLLRGTTIDRAPQPDALSQVEAALKALRQARDPEARRRATDALEKAVQNLRGRRTKELTPADPASRP